jgi:hypothetical protein
MKGLGISAKTMSNILLVMAILISLFLGSYTFLVSNHAATLPTQEGLEDKKKEEDSKKSTSSTTSLSSQSPTTAYTPSAIH